MKYLLAGGTAALVDLLLLYFFTDILGIWYLFSACLAFILSFFVSFFLQKFWTFGDRDKERMSKQMLIYLAVALVNLVINAVLMYLLVDGFKIWYILAQIISSGLIAVESYLIYNFFIFDRRGQGGELAKEGIGSSGKILIATGIYPPDIGGPATMLKALAKSLKEQSFLVKIITYTSSQGNNGRGSDAVYKINKNQMKLFACLKYFFRLWHLAGWAEIIYATDIYSVGYFVYLLKKVTGRKYIVRFAGDSAWETAVASGVTSDYIVDFQKKKYDRKIERLKARRRKILLGAERVIAVSNFMSLIAQEIGVKPENIKVIYNSIDFMPLADDDGRVAEIKRQLGGSRIIMTACRLTPWKGVAGIIKILPEIRSKLTDVKLVVLGDGPELPKLRRLAQELAVSNEVKFLGKIEHGQILNYFRAADVFVLNTNYEGLSHTLLEAMKAGVPIITTDAGGNPEVITDGQEGILIKYNHLGELGAAVVRVLSDIDLRHALTSRAKEKLKVFNWDKTIEQTVATLKEVL